MRGETRRYLEQISNGIQAAIKIQGLYNSSYREMMRKKAELEAQRKQAAEQEAQREQLNSEKQENGVKQENGEKQKNGEKQDNNVKQVSNQFQNNQRISGAYITSDTIALIGKILSIVAEYSPSYYKDTLSYALHKTAAYSGAYSNVKKNLQTVSSRQIQANNLVSILGAMKPLLRENQKPVVDKILKIYEIINS